MEGEGIMLQVYENIQDEVKAKNHIIDKLADEVGEKVYRYSCSFHIYSKHTWRPIVFIQPGVQDMSIIIYTFKVSVEWYWSWPRQSYL